MGLFRDLTGQRFGRLVVLYRSDNIGNRVAWHCLCDCGKEKDVKGSLLIQGKTRSCGCLSDENRHLFKEDLTGQRFGRLIVLNRCKNKINGYWKWHCLCDCGNTIDVVSTSLKNGNTKSCGCLAKETHKLTGKLSKGRKSKSFIDLTGQRFGLLTVIERVENTNRGCVRWLCKCDCGKETKTTTAHLRSGHTKSCGCLGLKHATEAKITHGQSKTPLYRVFLSMHNRCELTTSREYKWYGAKGIKVCEEWKDFQTFANWAYSHGYEKGLTIDRIDPKGIYCPENCEWVTRSENTKRMHRTKT